MKLKLAVLFFFSSLMQGQICYSQKIASTDYYNAIKKADLNKLWFNAENQPENDSISVTLPEPLGFIGDTYQRFYIHFISVKQNKLNPYQYIVTGKTKVKENICG
ncbi:MAG: hypothetical protein ABI091_29410, partial [Ferruginibacter sp.]